ELLSKRFGDSNLLQQEHLSALSSLPCCYSSNDSKGLRKITDMAVLNFQALSTLGVEESVLGPTLFVSLSRALPRDLLMRFHRERSSADDTSFSDSGIHLLKFLKDEVNLLERCSSYLQAGAANASSRLERQPHRKSNNRPHKPVHMLQASSKSLCCFLC